MIGCPLDLNILFCDAFESEKARADCVLLGWHSSAATEVSTKANLWPPAFRM
jgi:hypothetical protein